MFPLHFFNWRKHFYKQELQDNEWKYFNLELTFKLVSIFDLKYILKQKIADIQISAFHKIHLNLGWILITWASVGNYIHRINRIIMIICASINWIANIYTKDLVSWDAVDIILHKAKS